MILECFENNVSYLQLTSRKSSSTPSLNEVSEPRQSVATTEQAASAENLTAAVKAVSISFYLFACEKLSLKDVLFGLQLGPLSIFISLHSSFGGPVQFVTIYN